jgi:hypothetical protein
MLQAALALAILPDGVRADPAEAGRLAKAGEFAANGEISCAQEVGQSLARCDAAVARAGGSAVVVVTFPNGFSRSLTFADGKFLRGNPTMSGVGTDTAWRLADGVHYVRVDDQRFEIPNALVAGE